MFKDVQKLVLNDDEDYGEDAFEEFIEEDLGSGSSSPVERFLSEHSSRGGSRQPSRDYNRPPPQRLSTEMRPGTGSSELSALSPHPLSSDYPKFSSRVASVSSKPKLASRVQALQILEDSLADRIMALGCQDPSTVSMWKKVVGEYNDVGLGVLSEGTHEPKLALSCVQRAMELVEAKIGFGDEHDRKKMAAITLNNMSCMYHRMGCYKLALQHAERALRIEASSKKWDNPAVTHLNMAVILSKLKRHEHAAQHCQCALAVLEDGHVGSNSPSVQPPPGKTLLDSSVRAIAHFNLAVECEFLNQLDTAAHHYNMSIAVARSDCGAESATALSFEGQALEALNDLAKKKRAKASKSSPEKLQPLVPKLDLSLLQVPSTATAHPSGRSSDRKMTGSATASPASARNITASSGNVTARSARNAAAAGTKQPLSARGQHAQLKVGGDGVTCFDIRTPRHLLPKQPPKRFTEEFR